MSLIMSMVLLVKYGVIVGTGIDVVGIVGGVVIASDGMLSSFIRVC